MTLGQAQRWVAIGYKADLTSRRTLSSTCRHRCHRLSHRRHDSCGSQITAPCTYSAATAAGGGTSGARSWLGSSLAASFNYGRRRATSTASVAASAPSAATASETTTTTNMSLSAQDLEITVILSSRSSSSSPPSPFRPAATTSEASSSTGSGASTLTIKASHLDPNTGVRRTWSTLRSEQEFSAVGITLRGALRRGSGELVVPPPPGSAPAVFQGYLRRMIDVPLATSVPALYEFLDAPPELTQEPVLHGEIISGDDFGRGRRRFRSADPSKPRTVSSAQRGGDNTPGAAVAGAVVGGLVGGPMGAAIGAVAARAASRRGDGVGDVAKGAGGVADAVIEKAQDIEREYELSSKAKTAAGRAAKVVQKVDTDLAVRKRAKTAATTAVRAAQKAERDFRVRERAGEAAKVAEQTARKAAEAAKKADKDHRLMERAGNALKLVRSKVKSLGLGGGGGVEVWIGAGGGCWSWGEGEGWGCGGIGVLDGGGVRCRGEAGVGV
eukprot:jgi/Undpi1/6992/HiC_scaffold_21.g09466.m1